MRRNAARQPFTLAALACALVLVPAGGEAVAQQREGAAAAGVEATASQSKREVRRLQRKLGIPADGVFGPQTKRAVRRFQRRRGLAADGIVGPVTRDALGLGPGPVLKRERSGPRSGGGRSRGGSGGGGSRGGGSRGGGRSGDGRSRGGGRSGSRSGRSGRGSSGRSAQGGGVRSLQRALGIPADGMFGPQTESAVRRFQRRNGLVADGVVGPVTREALGIGSGPTLQRSEEPSVPDGGRGAMGRLIQAANRIAELPYKFGGGHRTFDDSGYDCSGSLSYALHAAGLLRYALDSSGFMRYGEPGPGRRVTIYANESHAFMVVDGRRYDTSAIRETGSR
jgi:peptidoglycan hydrolase-like protein with peptidoglycan-binding domain